MTTVKEKHVTMELPARSRVLVVDDELAVRRLLATSLPPKGIDVDEAATAAEALASLRQRLPSVVILDLGLPDVPGLQALSLIRERTSAPVIVLTASDSEQDKVGLLEAGADDYLTKPFSVPELVARLHVAQRRATGAAHAPVILEHGPFSLRLNERKAFMNGEALKLTGTEFAVLKALVEARGQVVLQKAILEGVWGAVGLENAHYLRIYVGMLRKKIERDPSKPERLLTEPGIGYRLQVK